MLNPLPQLPVYAQLSETFVGGDGCFVSDETGTRYLDFYGGHAVAAVGHCHPKLVAAISEQAAKLIFYSNISDHPLRQAFCERLLAHMPAGLASVFLANSGTEANENALTLARLTTGRKTIVTVSGGFHGRSLLALSVSGIEKYRKLATVNGEALFPYVRVLEMNASAEIATTIDSDCAAVIIEPVQGLAGAIDAAPPFLAALRARCDETGSMLIFDEVQCGAGRSCAYTAAESYGVTPDILTMAKGLAGGFPIGATIANESITAQATGGMLGSTFGGGPLACAAGLATLDIIENERLLARVDSVSEYLKTELARLAEVVAVHGRGLLLGIELAGDSAPVRACLRTRHHIIAGGSNRAEIIRIMPPLILEHAHAERFVNALDDCLKTREA